MKLRDIFAIFCIVLIIGFGYAVGAAGQRNTYLESIEDKAAELDALRVRLQGAIDEMRWAMDSGLSFGVASWYGPGFHGRMTASGEEYDMFAMTAAHKDLPFGTEIRIENMINRKVAVATVNDRGPFVYGRMLDVSLGVARQLGMAEAGLVPVKVCLVPSALPMPRLSGRD